MAANDAWSKHLFDNRYGTGQSTIAAILRLTNLAAAGKRFCIVGYGWVGKGLAHYAEGQGGKVTVSEIDPALEAHLDGHRVAPHSSRRVPDGDVVITGTGVVEALGAEHFPYLKDGALLANAGHHDREIDASRRSGRARDCQGSRATWSAAKVVYLLAGGHLVNIGRRRPPGRDHGSLLLRPGALGAPARLARAWRRACRGCLPVSTERSPARSSRRSESSWARRPRLAAQRRFREDWTL